MSNDSRPTVALFGLPVSNVSMSEAVERIAEWIESGTLHQVITANLDFTRNARKSEFLHRLVCECSMVLPDGAPLLWASRLLRQPLKERVTGVDLIPELARLSAARGYGIFLLGTNEKNTRAAAATLKRTHPGVRLVGAYVPPIAFPDTMDDEKTLGIIEVANPDILLVAFGSPKQEIWISRNFHRLQVPVVIGVGASLDIIAGSLRRAPKWIQAVHLEWLFRMLQDPTRLAPLYARDFKALLWHLPIEFVANRMQPRQQLDWSLAVEVEGNDRVVHIPEILTGEDCVWLIVTARAAARLGQTLILDMSATSRLEADGLGSMIEARRLMMVANCAIWLTGVAPAVQNVLEASSLDSLFRSAATPAEAIQSAHQALPHPDRRKRTRTVSGTPRTQPRQPSQSASAPSSPEERQPPKESPASNRSLPHPHPAASRSRS